MSPIADPLASDKMAKKLLKLIKKSMKDKLVKRGVKETVKGIRKGQQGYTTISLIPLIEFALLLQTFRQLMCYLTSQFFAKKRTSPTSM